MQGATDRNAAPAPTPPRESAPTRGVLQRDRVRVVSQPALVDCSGGEHGSALTVVPLMDGERIAGLEVKCSCGASTLIECIYPTEVSR